MHHHHPALTQGLGTMSFLPDSHTSRVRAQKWQGIKISKEQMEVKMALDIFWPCLVVKRGGGGGHALTDKRVLNLDTDLQFFFCPLVPQSLFSPSMAWHLP